jgi:hypothetical protein
MIIKLSYDSSVTAGNFTGGAAEEAAFKGAMTYVVNELDSLFTNPVTINLKVGWGEYGGTPLSANALGQNLATTYGPASYSTISAALVNNASASGDPAQLAAVATLPASDPTGGGGFAITEAEAKAIGVSISPGFGHR